MKRCILLASGGMDAQISMGIMKSEGYDILPVYFDFGQNTVSKEIPAARVYSKSIAGKELEIIQLPGYRSLLESSWALSGDLEDVDKDRIFIPGRNIMFLLAAAIKGYYVDTYELVLSIHKSDFVSGDCKLPFTKVFEHALSLGMSTPKYEKQFKIVTPLVEYTKDEIIKIGYDLGLDLSESWSCYDNQENHCGVCYACRERINMFELSGVPDPTKYM